MSDKLIYEALGSLDNKKFKVSKTNEGFMRLQGVFGVCGVRNNNNRVYEKNNYKSMVVEMQQRIRTGSVLGELEHPQTMNITLENVSHKIDDIQIDENGQVTGTITLLNTPKGKIAQAIVEGGAPLFISSRATGSVDKNGNVTLEHLQTYDLVGSPGFSQAKLTLCEGLSEDLYGEINENSYWVTLPNGEDGSKIAAMPIIEGVNDKTNILEHKNMNNTTNEELLNRIEKLEKKVAAFKSPKNYFENVAAPIIQEWVDKEFRSDFAQQIDNYISKHLMEGVCEKIDSQFTKELAPKIDEWVTKEFAGAIDGYLKEEYSQCISDYLKEEYSQCISDYLKEEYSQSISDYIEEHLVPGMKDFLIEQYTPAIDKYLNEEYSKKITGWIVEEYSPMIENYLTEEVLPELKNSKKDDILNTIAALESLAQPQKETYRSRKSQITESLANEPRFITEMPETARVKWNMASDAVKESIKTRAKIYNFNSPTAINSFWESVSFQEPVKPEEPHYVDAYEKRIRESIKAWRAMK